MIRHFFLPISSGSLPNSTSEEKRPSVSTAFQGESVWEVTQAPGLRAA
jgi:hypothetical protein